jgi:uncharacterized membrane protein required for colicin V production
VTASVSPLDGLFALLAAWFLVRGALKGLSGEIGSLVGSAGGLWAAFRFGPRLAAPLGSLTGLDARSAGFLAVLGLFLAILLVAALMTRALRALLQAAHLSPLDRLLGGVAGGAKLLLLAILVYSLGTLLNPILPEGWADRSVTMRAVSGIAPEIWERLLRESSSPRPPLPSRQPLRALPIDPSGEENP